MDKTEKRIAGYSSLLIALFMSSPRFLALRENGIVSHYWHFNLGELVFQLLFNLAYCYFFLYFNLKPGKGFSKFYEKKHYVVYFISIILFMLLCCIAGGVIQRHVFGDMQIRGMYWPGYLTRYMLSTILAAIILKIIALLRESKQKGAENEQLKTAYLEAELELLKEQLNPHFLFNSLSTLSGIIREDATLAQHFISHLSKIFRYALSKSGTQTVTIDNELTMIRSYEQLLKMRFEDAFKLEIAIDEKHLSTTIPHLSLQPLLENAAKHNSATAARPLVVKIFMEDDNLLVVSNNLQELLIPESSTGIGLVNLNSRFRILMHKEIDIIKRKESFTVKLPLL